MILQLITGGDSMKLPTLILTVLGFLVSGMLVFTLHDFAQTVACRICKQSVKVTCNPIKQLKSGFSWLGAGVLIFFGAGFKAHIKHSPKSRVKALVVAISGPVFCAVIGFVMLLLQALIISQAELEGGWQFIYTFLSTFQIACFTTAIFSLLPVSPLDGGHIVSLLLPEGLREKFLAFNLYPIAAVIVLIAILARCGAVTALWEFFGSLPISIL